MTASTTAAAATSAAAQLCGRVEAQAHAHVEVFPRAGATEALDCLRAEGSGRERPSRSRGFERLRTGLELELQLDHGSAEALLAQTPLDRAVGSRFFRSRQCGSSQRRLSVS